MSSTPGAVPGDLSWSSGRTDTSWQVQGDLSWSIGAPRGVEA
ncbi:hypothetical protein ACFVYF_07005 [Streptomyces sp. NPDC058274]